jgi:hypothetical protein
MSTISIKDLPESVDLDRAAMRAIVGGARLGGRQNFPVRPLARTGRIVDFPTGFATYAVPDAGGLATGSKPRK